MGSRESGQRVGAARPPALNTGSLPAWVPRVFLRPRGARRRAGTAWASHPRVFSLIPVCPSFPVLSGLSPVQSDPTCTLVLGLHFHPAFPSCLVPPAPALRRHFIQPRPLQVQQVSRSLLPACFTCIGQGVSLVSVTRQHALLTRAAVSSAEGMRGSRTRQVGDLSPDTFCT